MNLLQAAGYFLREAISSTKRGWRVALVAVLTIAAAMTVLGIFFVSGAHLESTIDRWRSQLQVTIYLHVGSRPSEALIAELDSMGWIESYRVVDGAEAQDRLADLQPEIASILGQEISLPPTVQVSTRGDVSTSLREEGVHRLEGFEGVDWVDDDRSWLERLTTTIDLVRTAAGVFVLGALALAVFLVAAVIKLTAYQHLDEIAVLRLVGATEFLIRGPFYFEGLLQGALGGALASAMVVMSERFALQRLAASQWLPTGDPVAGVSEVIALVAVGALAGLVGAVVSIGRERFEVQD